MRPLLVEHPPPHKAIKLSHVEIWFPQRTIPTSAAITTAQDRLTPVTVPPLPPVRAATPAMAHEVQRPVEAGKP